MPNIQSVLDVIHHCYFVIVIVPNVANEITANGVDASSLESFRLLILKDYELL